MARILSCLLTFIILLNAEAQSVRLLSLPECIDIALQNNLQVRQGYFNLKSAEISLRQSRMNLLPTFNLASNLGKNFGRAINPVTNAFINRNSNTLNFLFWDILILTSSVCFLP